MTDKQADEQIIKSLDHQGPIDALIRGLAPRGPLGFLDARISAAAGERYKKMIREAAEKANARHSP